MLPCCHTAALKGGKHVLMGLGACPDCCEPGSGRPVSMHMHSFVQRGSMCMHRNLRQHVMNAVMFKQYQAGTTIQASMCLASPSSASLQLPATT